METACSLPTSFLKIQVTSLSRNFRNATQVIRHAMPQSLPPGHLLVRNTLLGINASDVNYTAGVYRPSLHPPFDCGFESLGTVMGVPSPGALPPTPPFPLGGHVLVRSYGAFAEYQVVRASQCTRLPDPPRVPLRGYLPLLTSGVTASVALEQLGGLQPGGRVLVTAAAGGTGQFAVQLAKHAYGCTVFGTCSSEAKAGQLRQLGCDRPIVYTQESVERVLRAEAYGKSGAAPGLQLVYESVGGELLKVAVSHLANKGRVLIMGSMGEYASGRWKSRGGEQEGLDGSDSETSRRRDCDAPSTQSLPSLLLCKSASMVGFFLPHFSKHIAPHLSRLMEMLEARKIESVCDASHFSGIHSVASAVEHLYTGRSLGKVIVELP